MEKFLEKAVELGTEAGGKILVALLVYLIGSFLIKKILKMVGNLKALKELDASVFSFAMSAIKALLYIILIISIISVLGIPMASVIAVLASAGLAVGMALQGALGNLAGGIMLMIFKPFKVGDLVEAAGAVGIVKEITLFYTVLDTTDNRRITVPNGSLMNANVDNYTANATRRVDMVITCERGADVDQVQNIIYDVMNKYEKILKDPAPFASVSGATDTAMEITVRPHCNPADYWDVYFYVAREVTKAFGAAGIKAPAVRYVTDK